jgi:hypothetical protein
VDPDGTNSTWNQGKGLGDSGSDSKYALAVHGLNQETTLKTLISYVVAKNDFIRARHPYSQISYVLP